MIKIGVYLGCSPRALGLWRGWTAASAKVYHLVNPSPTTYAALLPFILSSLPSDLQAKLVSVNEWDAKLQSSDPTPELNPPIKLPDFFQGLFEMQKA